MPPITDERVRGSRVALASEPPGDLSGLLDLTRDALLAMDLDCRITWWTRGAERLYGWTASEAVGRSAEALLGTPGGDMARAYGAVLSTGEWSGELAQADRHGRRLVVEACWMLTREGDRQRVLVRHSDLTEQRLLEQQFRHAQKMENVGLLAAGIAHDFNNLLTVINGIADLMLDHPALEPMLRQDVQEIRHAGQRATALTRQLLAFSKRQKLNPSVVNLNAIVGDMQRTLARLVGEDVRLVLEPDAALVDVHADPGQLEQVLANIAVNAHDAMPQGGQLTIATRTVDVLPDVSVAPGQDVRPGRYAGLVIADTGCGMSESVRRRLFEPFFTTKEHGSGLGLATVYAIVRQNHGYIWVESAAGRGTTFNILLPEANADLRSRSAAAPHPPAGTETVLVVDDVSALRRFAQRVLESAGYTVLTAATVPEAIAQLESAGTPIDLVLTDVVMPASSGRLLGNWCVRHRPSMKLLYMSGYTQDLMARHGIASDSMPFLSKPFTVDELLDTVRRVLDA